MEQITKTMLQRKIDYLNKISDSPATTWTRRADGQLIGNVGNFHLDGAYGGYSLARTVNEGGGESDVFRAGHMKKRELFDRLCAFIDGYEFCLNPDRY